MKESKAKKICCILLFLLFLTFKRKNINIMYMFSNNFGDNLNNYILKDIIKAKIKFYDVSFKSSKDKFFDKNLIMKLNEIANIDLFFIGSNLDSISNWSYIFNNPNNYFKSIISKWYFKIIDYFYPLIIFGSGFISPSKYKYESYVRNIKIIAIRGNISLQRFKNNGINFSKNVVLADPGILSPMLININDMKEIKEKKYTLCIIPHYIDSKNEILKTRIKINNSIILNIEDNPHKFLNSLTLCENVLSSGLHGLIAADSLGIPNQRMIISDKIIGGDYKFRDYYSSYGMQLPQKFDLRKKNFTERHLVYLKNNYKINQHIIRKKQCQLLINFPFILTNKYEKIKRIICR